MPFVGQKTIKVEYKDAQSGSQRVDFLIEDSVIVELKCVPGVLPIHKAQIISYLKTSRKNIGLILNFAKNRLEIARVVNNS